MSNLAFSLGYPVEFKKLCLIYPPKVKDVVANKNYALYTKFLTISQEEIEDDFVKKNIPLDELLTPFEYLLNNAHNSIEFKTLLEQSFYFYIHENVTILPEQKKIIIGDISETKQVQDLRILEEQDFFEFQNLIRETQGAPPIEPPNPNEDARVKAIKAKARYRDQIKEKKGLGNKLETLLSSIYCMNYGLNPLNIGELSYAAIPDLIARYQEKEKYETDIKSLLAGADSKKIKPKYWIRNLD